MYSLCPVPNTNEYEFILLDARNVFNCFLPRDSIRTQVKSKTERILACFCWGAIQPLWQGFLIIVAHQALFGALYGPERNKEQQIGKVKYNFENGIRSKVICYLGWWSGWAATIISKCKWGATATAGLLSQFVLKGPCNHSGLSFTNRVAGVLARFKPGGKFPQPPM